MASAAAPARTFGLTSAQWSALAVGVGLLLLLLWFAYQRGLTSGGLAIADNARDRRELLTTIATLEKQNGELNARIAELEMSRTLDREAYGQVERTLGELQSSLSRQSDDLAFYRSIVSPADGIAGLRIQRFDVVPSGVPREFLLRLTLIQAMRHDSAVAGLVQIVMSGMRDGRPAQLSVGELLGRPKAQLPFSFKYFQTIEQTITLPEGFDAFDADIEVRSSKLKAPLKRRFPWKPGPQPAL